jgi:beta-lactamase class A
MSINKITVFLFFILGLVIGIFLPNIKESRLVESSELRVSGKFTSPLLECEVASDTIASKKIDFTVRLEKFVDEIRKKNDITDLSVYFRDLNNGPIVGINQNISFSPASLLKVPVLIAYLKRSEDDISILDKKILYSEKINTGFIQEYAPSFNLEVGKVYTVKELLEIMIKYSNNEALIILHQDLPKNYQDELYTLLGVDPKLIYNPNEKLTVRQYSIFFRILFNASFISKNNSEYALDLLSQTSFTKGLRAGVPDNIIVSHKFGERKIKDDEQQFHDCGIVYYPNHPYLLCVMTRGKYVTDLISILRQTSDFVYKEIDGQYKNN